MERLHIYMYIYMYMYRGLSLVLNKGRGKGEKPLGGHLFFSFFALAYIVIYIKLFGLYIYDTLLLLFLGNKNECLASEL